MVFQPEVTSISLATSLCLRKVHRKYRFFSSDGQNSDISFIFLLNYEPGIEIEQKCISIFTGAMHLIRRERRYISLWKKCLLIVVIIIILFSFFPPLLACFAAFYFVTYHFNI